MAVADARSPRDARQDESAFGKKKRDGDHVRFLSSSLLGYRSPEFNGVGALQIVAFQLGP